MEPKFQTSFIPKKPISPLGGFGGMSGGLAGAPSVKVSHKGVSIFMTIAVIVFVLSLAAIGGAYLWKGYLKQTQQEYKVALAERERQFDIGLIERLKQIETQINTSKQLLANHIALSQAFDIISRMTIANVRFLSMDLSMPAGGKGGINVSMKGYGTSLQAVAFQSDVLGQLSLYGLSRDIRNPIVSDPTLDPNGSVNFGFSAALDPGSLSYKESLVPDDTGSTTTETQ